jgi:hypothetical protein
MILYGNGELGKLASRFFDFYKINYIICEDTPSQEGVITLDDITDTYSKNKVINVKEFLYKNNKLISVI